MLNKYFVAAFAWTLLLTVLCLVNTGSLEEIDVIELDGKDKIIHFSFYFVFTIAWYMFFKSRYGSNAKVKGLTFLFAVFYGVLIEVLQYLFTSGRSADVMDALANSAGSAFAIACIWLYNKIKS